MTTNKKALPSLAGVRHRVRKRQRVIAADPDKFISTLCSVLDQTMDPDQVFPLIDRQNEDDLDFHRYGDIFFDVFISGGIGACLGHVDPTKEPYKYSFYFIHKSQAPNAREQYDEIIELLRQFIRRKPYLEKYLKQDIEMLLNSFLLLDPIYQEATTTAAAYLIGGKILRPDALNSLRKNDSNVASGQAISILSTIICKLQNDLKFDIQVIIKMFKDGHVFKHLMDFFPPQKRTKEHFTEHFNSLNLNAIVVVTQKTATKETISELHDQIVHLIEDELDEKKIIEELTEEQVENSFTTSDMLKTIFSSVMDAVDWSTKSQQQTEQAIQQIEDYAGLFVPFAAGHEKDQLQFMNDIQQWCYDRSTQAKSFLPIIRALYFVDAIEEDVIIEWYKRGATTRGKELFKGQIEPMIQWFALAEEMTPEEAKEMDEARIAIDEDSGEEEAS
ncbi:putative ARM repeat superfamily protein [Blattamonas nauphoetae]|uniref:ARM repeat superfamily protein n=1 Tax=Blattamonas nauphoetae TaxID=2049346 RepID=A0ABQ9YKA7_9EUKA|nr:putative ARM repeat superfamily protein [Blattamonas nauphoetae]